MSSQRPHLFRWTFTLVVVAAWAFALASLMTFHPTDWPSHAVYPWARTQNLCGNAGAFLAYHAFTTLGAGSYAILFFGGLFLAMKIWGQTLGDFWLRTIGLLMVSVGLGAFVHLMSPGAGGMPEGSGGVMGIAAETYLRSHFNTLGTTIVLGVAMLTGLLLAADELVIRLPIVVGRAAKTVRAATPNFTIHMPELPRLPSLPRFVTRDALADKFTDKVVAKAPKAMKKPLPELPDPLDAVAKERPAAVIARKAKKLKEEAATAFGGAVDEIAEPTQIVESAMVEQADVVEVDDAEDDEPLVDEADIGNGLIDEEEEPLIARVDAADEETIEEKPPELRKDIVVRLAASTPTKRTAPPPQELGDYQMPVWDVLADAEHGYAESQEKHVREKAAVLEQALTEFGIDAHVVAIDTGPVITMYELALAAGIRVSAITALTNDIARALSAVSIRIIAPVPGKNTVGIEVPNAEKEKVRMKELMQTAPEKTQKFAIPLYLGKDASGQPLIADLHSMPHCLIAGTTGSGKSVCINSIIMSIMYTQRPDMVKLILVDPKVVEMAPFKDIPHLMCPVITESAKATSVLEWACVKMEERYALLAEAGVRNIGGYNGLTREELKERFCAETEEEEAKIPKKLPYLVIVIDELADLMMTSGKEVEAHIVRIAQKARAVGIHLVLATQRPQATVVTGLIKANMPCKIAFRVSSRMDSRIVLDMNGAEVLLGQGDMLYLANGASKPTRCQGTFIDDNEVRASAKLVKSLAEQQFEPELVQIRSGSLEGDPGERDPLFDDAVRVVLESKRGSVSLLQRKLTIGYGRASRIVEEMAAAGILGDHKGSQAREPLITIEEWEAIKNAQTQDEEEGMTV